MVDDVKKADMAREDRLRQVQQEQFKPKPKESSEFDKALAKMQKASDLLPQQQQQTKTVTEDAIREAVRRDDRQQDRRRDEDEGKNDGKEQKGERAEGKVTDQKILAKGKLKQWSGGSGGKGQGGFDSGEGRRGLSKMLLKTGVKSLPVDLQGKFAQKLAQSVKNAMHAGDVKLAQHILNKLVQYVKVGINRKGEKEMRVELNEKIFSGLKLKVTSHEGKVSVYFKTSDKKSKSIFEKNREAIGRALKDKGIIVDEIVIL